MPYFYKLSYSTRTKDILPKSIGKIVVAKEQDEAFFREKLSGSLEVSGDDYTFLQDAKKFADQCCQQISLTILKSCGRSAPVLYWPGTFNLSDIAWDEDNKTATIKKITVADQYNVIFQNWHKQINWLDILNGLPSFIRARYSQTTPTSEDYNPQGTAHHERAMLLVGALQWLVNQTMIGTPQEGLADFITPGDYLSFSNFMFAVTNPVTGKPNYLRHVLLEHLSEAKRPGATNEAREGYVTLKEVLSELKTMFNAYWYIDDAGKFHIEHISFFPQYSYGPKTVKLDLTANSFKETMKGLNRYEYQQDKLAGIESVAWNLNESSYKQSSEVYGTSKTNPSIQDFNGAYMIYSNTCAPKSDNGEKVMQSKSVSMFTTDYIGITLKPDTMPDEGWYLVHVPVYLAADGVSYGWSPISGSNYKNGCLSATRLYYDFGRYENSFTYGVFSNQPEKPRGLPGIEIITERPLQSRTVKAIKAMASVSLDMCCGKDYDFSGYIKHPSAPECIVEQLEYDLLTQTVEVSMLGINTCVENLYPDYSEDDTPPASGCKAKGELIRTQVVNQVMDTGWTLVTTIYTYADGDCGEYYDVKVENHITN